MNIQINKRPKTGFFKGFFKTVGWWITILFSFYFNYKFINGNNFLDFIIFITVIISLISYVVYWNEKYNKIYHDVSDDKFKEIEELLYK